MQRPRIGIPLCLDDRGRWRPGHDYLYIDRRYAAAIDRAGGEPVHLPVQSEAARLVDALDGLLLPGGDDFPSDRALPADVRLAPVPETQRAFDADLYRAASEQRLPILGICYGMQLMAHVQHGRLEPHLPSADLAADDHRLPADRRHPIEVAPESRLARILGPGTHEVNSLHHQGVRETGAAHIVAARAADGVIEAIERANAPEDRWEIGVQWHPEKQDDAPSEALFDAFVTACRHAGEKESR